MSYATFCHPEGTEGSGPIRQTRGRQSSGRTKQAQILRYAQNDEFRNLELIVRDKINT